MNAQPVRVVLVLFTLVGSALAIQMPPRAADYGESMQKAKELVAAKRYEAALELLGKFKPADDIYSCDCNDARHYHHSGERRLMIVDCLLALGKQDEARAELRALYEFNAGQRDAYFGGYRFPEKVNLQLIDLETAHDTAGFWRWLDKLDPDGQSTGQIRKMIGIKQEVEAGKYERAFELLGGVDAYNPYVGHKEPYWTTQGAIRYLLANPRCFDSLVAANARDQKAGSPQRGMVYVLGELGDKRAIPALKESLLREKNWYYQNEARYALAKLGDASVARDLLGSAKGAWAGVVEMPLPHVQFIDSLLRRATGQSFGEIKSKDDAAKVFAEWEAWVKAHPATTSAPAGAN